MSKLYFLRKEYLSVWWIRQSYLFLIPFLFVLQASAQETIQGIVLDQDDEPVPWATVAVKSTTSGTTTDLDGTFSLKVEESLPVTLSISFVGYKTHEIEVDDTDDDIRIVLEEDVNLLDEVVITGYTVERRRSVTAAIESVDFDEAIANQADQDLTKRLQGKASGVQIVSTSGNPGEGSPWSFAVITPSMEAWRLCMWWMEYLSVPVRRSVHLGEIYPPILWRISIRQISKAFRFSRMQMPPRYMVHRLPMAR